MLINDQPESISLPRTWRMAVKSSFVMRAGARAEATDNSASITMNGHLDRMVCVRGDLLDLRLGGIRVMATNSRSSRAPRGYRVRWLHRCSMRDNRLVHRTVWHQSHGLRAPNRDNTASVPH